MNRREARENAFKLLFQYKFQPADIEELLARFFEENDAGNQQEYIRAADLLEQADRVLCMGQGGSMIIAMEAAHLFSTASGKFFSVTDSHMQAIAIATAGENDVILFFSYSGATKDLIETLSYARERGLRSILVTHFANSPGAGLRM